MDDEEMFLHMVEHMLQHLGYEDVELAVNGRQAVEKYQEAWESGKPFDVALLDLTVKGGMGGKEALGNMLMINPTVKAIVTSGYSTDPVMSVFQEYGFKGVLSKPYNMQDLEQELFKVIRS
jgi:two-component system, cell cycle sensor histidine kinase and response regulator CckA